MERINGTSTGSGLWFSHPLPCCPIADLTSACAITPRKRVCTAASQLAECCLHWTSLTLTMKGLALLALLYLHPQHPSWSRSTSPGPAATSAGRLWAGAPGADRRDSHGWQQTIIRAVTGARLVSVWISLVKQISPLFHWCLHHHKEKLKSFTFTPMQRWKLKSPSWW